jgi:hypothetical protein
VNTALVIDILPIVKGGVENLILPHVQVQDDDDEENPVVEPLACQQRRKKKSKNECRYRKQKKKKRVIGHSHSGTF